MINSESQISNKRVKVTVDVELQEIVPSFLSNREKDVQSIREFVSSGDFKGIERIGHIMKGAGGGYGFDTVSEIGAAIEHAATAQDRAKIEENLQRLDMYLKEVDVVYQ